MRHCREWNFVCASCRKKGWNSVQSDGAMNIKLVSGNFTIVIHRKRSTAIQRKMSSELVMRFWVLTPTLIPFLLGFCTLKGKMMENGRLPWEIALISQRKIGQIRPFPHFMSIPNKYIILVRHKPLPALFLLLTRI